VIFAGRAVGDLIVIEGGKDQDKLPETVVVECPECQGMLFNWRTDNELLHIIGCASCGTQFLLAEPDYGEEE
jgi:hypothetical protein